MKEILARDDASEESGESSGSGSATPPQGNPPPGGPALVSIAEIAGVTAPAAEATPVPEITANDEYTGSVEWKLSESGEAFTGAAFAAETEYTATITLAPKAGYTFSGVAENFFTVAGADSATNPADSGVVTAVFPKTAPDDGPEDPANPITGITILPNVAVVALGGSQQFTVASLEYADTTTVTNPGSGEVNWEVSGGGSGTTISAAGLLTVSSAETAPALNVKAVSKTGGVESDPATVTVTATLPEVRRNRDGQLYATLAEAIADSAGTAAAPELLTILTNITASTTYEIPSDKHIQLVVEAGKSFTISEQADYGAFIIVEEGTLILGSDDPAGGTLTLQGTDTDNFIRNFNILDGTLIMYDGVTIRGLRDALQVGEGSTFTMKGGRIEYNNTSPSHQDNAAVLVFRSTFIMESGYIANNTGRRAGGVSVTYGGTFICRGGIVYGSDDAEFANSASDSNGYAALYILWGNGTAEYGDGTPILTGGVGTDATITGHM